MWERSRTVFIYVAPPELLRDVVNDGLWHNALHTAKVQNTLLVKNMTDKTPIVWLRSSEPQTFVEVDKATGQKTTRRVFTANFAPNVHGDIRVAVKGSSKITHVNYRPPAQAVVATDTEEVGPEDRTVEESTGPRQSVKLEVWPPPSDVFTGEMCVVINRGSELEEALEVSDSQIMMMLTEQGVFPKELKSFNLASRLQRATTTWFMNLGMSMNMPVFMEGETTSFRELAVNPFIQFVIKNLIISPSYVTATVIDNRPVASVRIHYRAQWVSGAPFSQARDLEGMTSSTLRYVAFTDEDFEEGDTAGNGHMPDMMEVAPRSKKRART